MSLKIRNICTIAHVDHGKTTLVDFLLRQSGTFRLHENVAERLMDSQDLERERGITISAKNAAFNLDDTRVNIVDTPGHSDFGGEVERIMDMVDGAILLVDAAEGPLPQTRFVLEKAIRKGLKIILCVNKVDRPECAETDLVSQSVDKTFDLFVELGANDEQCDFPIVYACAREGWCTSDVNAVPELCSGGGERNLNDLFRLILEVPAPIPVPDPSHDGLKMLVSNISYDNFVGFLALGRLQSGAVKKGQTIYRHGIDGDGQAITEKFQVTRLFRFQGNQQVEAEELSVGDIGLIAGSEKFTIGDTVVADPQITPLERIEVESPTMRMIFSINTSPRSGSEGKAIQSRELKARLESECKSNPALAMEDTQVADQFYLMGRGELQFGIIIETMRREGYEFMVGRPNVLFKKDDKGQVQEPFEKLTLDLPEQYTGDVTNLFQQRKGVLSAYENVTSADATEPRVRLSIEIPTRGVLGTHSDYLTLTRGAGLISSEAVGYRAHCGAISHRLVGCLIADRSGDTTDYALNMLQQRGSLFLGSGVKLYEGMIIGESAKENDLNVNACRPKKLTNIRTTSSDGIVQLNTPKKMSLERCIEWIDDDEWIEITPETIRLRKKILPANQRSVRKADKEQGV
ncbi:MAG: translational GTPase TypA [Zetaproteobacteria bacterium]|nr:translational GTPase TypA [Pseudobdellovibrionaceae bacterium]